MATLRIEGLVRAFNQLRDELRRGIEPGAREAFRDRVEETVRTVEEICGARDSTPEHLPGPSRCAYRFLKTLDLEDLPAPREGASVGPPVRVSGVVRVGERLADRIWEKRDALALSEDERIALLVELAGHVAAVEDICESQGGRPAGLPIRSRRAYAWMKYLEEAVVLELHVEALRRAAGSAAALERGGDEGLRIRLVNTGALWRKKRGRARTLLTVSEGFLSAPAEVWEALVRPGLGDASGADRRAAREFADTEEFAAVILDMESWARPPGSARGRHHDLEASFARVNAAYFSGGMAKPILVWNGVPTLRKFGHYQPSRDTVMLSVTLDDPEVPEFVVDQVLFHELLHKKHGIVRVLGRGLAHTTAFRAEERRFARFREAQAHLHALARERQSVGRFAR